MNSVVHFEIPAANSERAKSFYADVFGWTFDDMPMGEESTYTVMRSVESDEKGIPVKPGAINGGLVEKKFPYEGPVLVLEVDDCVVAADKARNAGAEVVVEPVKTGEVGMYALIRDPEGNTLGLWETIKK